MTWTHPHAQTHMHTHTQTHTDTHHFISHQAFSVLLTPPPPPRLSLSVSHSEFSRGVSWHSWLHIGFHVAYQSDFFVYFHQRWKYLYSSSVCKRQTPCDFKKNSSDTNETVINAVSLYFHIKRKDLGPVKW